MSGTLRQCNKCGKIWQHTTERDRRWVIPNHYRFCQPTRKTQIQEVATEEIEDGAYFFPDDVSNFENSNEYEDNEVDTVGTGEDEDVSDPIQNCFQTLQQLADGVKCLDDEVIEDCRNCLNEMRYRKAGGPEKDYTFDYGAGARKGFVPGDKFEAEGTIYLHKQKLMEAILAKYKKRGNATDVDGQDKSLLKMVSSTLLEMLQVLQLSLADGDYLLRKLKVIGELHNMKMTLPKSVRDLKKHFQTDVADRMFQIYDYKKGIYDLFRDEPNADLFLSMQEEVEAPIGFYVDPMDVVVYNLMHLHARKDIYLRPEMDLEAFATNGICFSTPSTAHLSTLMYEALMVDYGETILPLPINLAFDATKIRSFGKQTATPVYIRLDCLREPFISKMESYSMVGLTPTLNVS